MKKICIEGPLEIGKWTEAIQAGFKAIGQESVIHYHNGADTLSKISNRLHNFLQRLGLPGMTVTWPQISNQRVLNLVRRHRCEVLVSLQGLIDQETVQHLRKINPRIRIIYWWGQQVQDSEQIDKLYALSSFVDVLAIPYQGDSALLQEKGAKNAVFLPFAACPVQHNVKLSTRARKKFSKDVILVGDYSEYREAILHLISDVLGQAVDVWGSGWSSNQRVNAYGPLFPPQSLQAYAAAKIVLNLHGQACTKHNGLNPKFFQIAAVGGFQITEDQPVLRSHDFRDNLCTFSTLQELSPKIIHFLKEASLREEMSRRLQNHVLKKETYGHRFFNLLKSMGYS